MSRCANGSSRSLMMERNIISYDRLVFSMNTIIIVIIITRIITIIISDEWLFVVANDVWYPIVMGIGPTLAGMGDVVMKRVQNVEQYREDWTEMVNFWMRSRRMIGCAPLISNRLMKIINYEHQESSQQPALLLLQVASSATTTNRGSVTTHRSGMWSTHQPNYGITTTLKHHESHHESHLVISNLRLTMNIYHDVYHYLITIKLSLTIITDHYKAIIKHHN